MSEIIPFPDDPLSLCSWNLVEFQIETPEVKLCFDRETAEEIHRCLSDFLDVYPSAG